jgi:hypothetical protein
VTSHPVLRGDRPWVGGLYLAALGAYLWTLAPGVYVEGSGELIGAVWWLGTAHPTGYPVYTVAARVLAALLPVTSPALAVNAATALLSALAPPLLFVLLRREGIDRGGALAGGAALGFGSTYWSQAVIAEVYGLFVVASLMLVILSQRAVRVPIGQRRRTWALVGYVAGLTALSHLQAVLLIPFALAAVLWSARRTPGWLRDLPWLIAGGLLGLSPLLYLVVRNGVGPGFHWGRLDSLGAFVDHITGALYRPSFLWLPGEALAAALSRLATQLAGEWPVALLPIALWGLVVAARRHRSLALILGGGGTANVIVALVYHRDPAGLDVFFLLLLLALCASVGVGWHDLGGRLPGAGPRLVTLAAGLLVPGLMLANVGAADRSQAVLPEAYGRRLLEELPPGAVLLTDGDESSYIVDYLHRVEGVRPDVEVYQRVGRGTDLAADDPALRRRREASLVLAARPVFATTPRWMPVPQGRFVPRGLSYHIDLAGLPPLTVDPAPSPTGLLDEQARVADPWIGLLAARCWFMEGEARRHRGDRSAAIEAYQKAGQAATWSRSMTYNVALRLLQLNQLESAYEFAERAIEADPLRRSPYALAGQILQRLGRRDAAENMHKRAAKWAQVP